MSLSSKSYYNKLGKVSCWSSVLMISILSLAWFVGFISRLFSVIRFESIIHEFDPWFNYRATKHMVDKGFYNFLNWFDESAWYPLGRILGGTVYPGLMVTSGSIYYFLNFFNFPVHIRDICVFLAPIFSGLTVIATFLLTKELWNTGAGLLAGSFIAIAPGYISRSVAGSYDNEGIAIFALMFTYYLWIKAVKTGNVFWSVSCALSYLYMVSAWGGYVFVINLIPLHVFVLILIQRYSSRIYVAYTSFYILGLLFSMQIPFVGFQPIRTSEHMASAGVFVFLQAYAFFKFLQSKLTNQLRNFFIFGVTLSAALVLLSVVSLTYLGLVAPWSGRFYSLWDTGYANIHIPIIASVSEHQPTSWLTFFFDLHMMACVFPAGMWLCVKQVNDERVFIVLYAITASYLAAVMVRLMLTLTPVVCVLSAVAFNRLFEIHLKEDPSANIFRQETLYDDLTKKHSPKKEADLGLRLKTVVVGVLVVLLFLFVVHCTWVTSTAYSSPSIVLASYDADGSQSSIIDDFREAYHWLSHNTAEGSRVMSWWDYGYQIAAMANRTTLVDNNTWNHSQIALVGKAMASNESVAVEMMRQYDVDYVLLVFGGLIGYTGDDLNKFPWMVRIAAAQYPGAVVEGDFVGAGGQYQVDGTASPATLDSLIYKASYHGFALISNEDGAPMGFDRARNLEIGRKHFRMEEVQEAYTSEHWLVRVYRVRPRSNRPSLGRTRKPIPLNISRKTATNGRGVLRAREVLVKGRRPRAL